MLNSFKGLHLCIKWGIIWFPDNQPDNQLQTNKNILLENKISKYVEYKICINNLLKTTKVFSNKISMYCIIRQQDN